MLRKLIALGAVTLAFGTATPAFAQATFTVDEQLTLAAACGPTGTVAACAALLEQLASAYGLSIEAVVSAALAVPGVDVAVVSSAADTLAAPPAGGGGGAEGGADGPGVGVGGGGRPTPPSPN